MQRETDLFTDTFREKISSLKQNLSDIDTLIVNCDNVRTYKELTKAIDEEAYEELQSYCDNETLPLVKEAYRELYSA